MKREDLLKALEIVKPGLAKRDLIEQTTSFAFIGGRVTTYNDEISISHPIEGLAAKLEGAIKAEELYKLLGKVKKDEIEIRQGESEVLLCSGRMEVTFPLAQEIKLPLDEIGDVGKFKPLPKDFSKALDFCIDSCSHDMSRPILTCVNVRADGRLQSSDNYRVTAYEVGEFPVKTFLLPASSARELIRYGMAQIAEGKGWVHFKNDAGTMFSCRTLQGEFPNVDRLFDVSGEPLELPKVLGEVLERAEIFSRADQTSDERVEVRIEARKCTISAQGDSGCKFKETCNIGYDGKPLLFAVNPHLLKAIAEQVPSCVISERCLKFSSERWEHVVALLGT